MIKYFQKLKAKKGFTLVELIVVIAIIGVLAAILIPTMLGYVTSSRVASADSTAGTIKDTLNAFITERDGANEGIQRKAGIIEIKITSPGSSDEESTTGGTTGGTSSDSNGQNGGIKVTVPTAILTSGGLKDDAFANKLAKKIAEDYTFSDAHIWCYIHNGTCIGCVYVGDNTKNELNITADTAQAVFTGGKGDWKDGGSTTEGISDGVIYGTSPKLYQADADGDKIPTLKKSS